MVSKNVVKLIDESIIPAVGLIVAKMLGLFLATYLYKLEITVENGAIFKVLPAIHFSDVQGYILAENFSNLAMLIFASLGTMLIIVRAHYLHQSHIRPKLHATLVRFNLESLIAPSYHLYHQAAIWLSYLWLVVAFSVVSSVFGATFLQISAIGFIIAANFSWIFALDIEKEIEINKIRV